MLTSRSQTGKMRFADWARLRDYESGEDTVTAVVAPDSEALVRGESLLGGVAAAAHVSISSAELASPLLPLPLPTLGMRLTTSIKRRTT